MLLFSSLALVVALGMGAFSKWKVPEWQKRDFGDRDFKWNLIISISTGLSLFFSHLAFFLSGNVWVSLCIGTLGFLVALSSILDFALMKMPSEITTLVQFAPLPFVLLLWPSFDFYDKTAIVMWFALVFIFTVISLMRMFGWADVKILFAFGTTLSWWVGPSYMIYAFMGAAVFALILIPIAPKIGYGSYTLKKRIGENTKWDAEEKKLVAVPRKPIELPAEPKHVKDTFISRLIKSIVDFIVNVYKNMTKKKRVFVPFGPALLISFLVMSLIAAGTMEVNTYTFFDLPK